MSQRWKITRLQMSNLVKWWISYPKRIISKQYGNLKIILPFRFYVKSILAIFKNGYLIFSAHVKIYTYSQILAYLKSSKLPKSNLTTSLSVKTAVFEEWLKDSKISSLHKALFWKLKRTRYLDLHLFFTRHVWLQTWSLCKGRWSLWPKYWWKHWKFEPMECPIHLWSYVFQLPILCFQKQFQARIHQPCLWISP